MTLGSEEIRVEIKRLDPDVELPSYAYEGDAGLDLRANEQVDLAPHERRLVSTGLAIAIPEGYAGFVQPRSGLALKNGVTVLNAPGTIDAGYRGEIGVVLANFGEAPFKVEPGMRIAQLVIAAVASVTVEVSDTLSSSERGAGGYGSTGV